MKNGGEGEGETGKDLRRGNGKERERARLKERHRIKYLKY